MFKLIKPTYLNNLSSIYTIDNLNGLKTRQKRIEYYFKIQDNHYGTNIETIKLIKKLWKLGRVLRYLLIGFLAKKKLKTFVIRNQTDLLLNDLDDNSEDTIKLIDYVNSSIYLFSYDDITRTWLSLINFNNFEIAEPLELKNPYNNNKLAFLEFYNIYRQYEEISYQKRRQIPLSIRLLRHSLLNNKKLITRHRYLFSYNASFNYVKNLNDELFKQLFIDFFNSLFLEDRPCPKCFKIENTNQYRDSFNRILALFQLEENGIVVEDVIKIWRKILTNYKLLNSESHKKEFHPIKIPKKTGKLIGKLKSSRKNPINQTQNVIVNNETINQISELDIIVLDPVISELLDEI